MPLLKKTTLLLLLLVFFTKCVPPLDNSVSKNIEVQDFIWKSLNQFYLWQENVPNLSDTKFSNQAQLNSFLENQPDPKKLFESLLYQYHTTDRFSYLFDDYTVLEQWLTGTDASNGIDYKLVRKTSDSKELFGWIRYIMPNSDAAAKGVTRGLVFYAVNGTPLTDSNYGPLLANTTYTLQLADYDNGNITPNGKQITLTKSAYAENPIYLNTVIEKGSKKIGYLMYNAFYGEYDNQLNEAFGSLKSQNITDLVLDLRYNGGGSIDSSRLLASMITGQFNGQLFSKQKWNAKMQAYLEKEDPGSLALNFVNTMDNGTAINSLKLNTVYVLTTAGTASASELLINCLKPYINVIQIGETTVGKNVGSVTLYDAVDFSKEKRSKNHTYAMQPIVVKTINKNGFGEYESGLMPSIYSKESIHDLGILGNESEPLLRAALFQITGEMVFAKTSKKAIEHTTFIDSKSINPVKTDMYLDKVPAGFLRNIE